MLIGIVGPSGSGKTSSCRNLPPDKTLFINLEEKDLPFPDPFGDRNFYLNGPFPGVKQKIENFLKDDKYEYIVFDSFAEYQDMMEMHFKDVHSGKAKGGEGYKVYGDVWKFTYQFFKKMKTASKNKTIIFLAIDYDSEEEGKTGQAVTYKRSIKVAGKKNLGLIDRHFTTLFFTDVVPGKTKDDLPTYRLTPHSDGITTARSPIGLFKKRFTEDNDIWKLIQQMEEYYKQHPEARKQDEESLKGEEKKDA